MRARKKTKPNAAPAKKKARKKEDPKKWENMLAAQLHLYGLGSYFKREFIIKELGRKWRWDFADPEHKVAIEFQGAIWIPNRGHSGGIGLRNDFAKGNAAQFHGWTVFHFDDWAVSNKSAVKMIDAFYQTRLGVQFPVVVSA